MSGPGIRTPKFKNTQIVPASSLSGGTDKGNSKKEDPSAILSDMLDNKKHMTKDEIEKEAKNKAQANWNAVLAEMKRLQGQGNRELKYAIVPTSNFRMMWDVSMLILLSFIALFTPYQIAFMQDLSYFRVYEWRGLFIWERIIDVYFVTDIFVNFRSAYVDSQGRVFFNQRVVARNYLKGFFVLDVITTIPWDMLELTQGADSGGGTGIKLKLPKLLRLLRLTKLLKVLRASRLFKRWEQALVMHMKFGVIRMFKFLFLFLLIVHWLGCFMCFFSFLNPNSPDTWVNQMGLGTASDYDIYVIALEWATQTLTTVGYGSVLAVNTDERWYVICGMIVGAAIFSYVIGTICTLVQGLMVTSLEFQSKMDLLATYMQQHNFPIELRARANQFCFYSMEAHGLGDTMGEQVKVLLSPAMQREASVHIYGDILNKVGMFKNTDDLFIAEIAMKLKSTTYAPMEYVFNEDEPVTKMYMIMSGHVQMEDWADDASGNPKLHSSWTIKTGDVFGDNFMYFLTEAYIAAHTMTYCEFSVLDRADFWHVLQRFPDFKDPMRKHTVQLLWQRIFRVLVIMEPGEIIDMHAGLDDVRRQAAAGGNGAVEQLQREGHEPLARTRAPADAASAAGGPDGLPARVAAMEARLDRMMVMMERNHKGSQGKFNMLQDMLQAIVNAQDTESRPLADSPSLQYHSLGPKSVKGPKDA